jgi:Fe2+ or Zn2+ uptake regulation protein
MTTATTSSAPWSVQADLRAAGLRATPQRIAILEAMHQSNHPTVESLWSDVKDRGIALPTVYRTLDSLEQAGLILRTALSQGRWTLHLADRADHAHSICTQCGLVEDLDFDGRAVPSLITQNGHAFDSHQVLVTLVGVGPCCAE